MGVHFITYGSFEYKIPAQKLEKSAQKLKIFESTQCFSMKDLPIYIKSSPLFSSSKGNGYWVWKAYIILHTLKKIQDDDIVFYCDGGCDLFPSNMWKQYQEELKSCNALFFQYRENYPYNFSQFNPIYNDSPKLKYWTKKTTIDHFKMFFNSEDEWLNRPKILGGIIFIKNNAEIRKFIADWLNLMLYKPFLLSDPLLDEKDQYPFFCEHRHDQSLITILIRAKQSELNLKILDEDFEIFRDGQAIKASRNKEKDTNFAKNLIKKIYYYFTNE